MDECISPNLVFSTTQMSDYTRNRYRLDTTSATVATAGQIITVNFPEASLLDMKSFRFFFQVICNQANTGSSADHVFARCPDDASTFVQKLEVYLNGVQVSSGQNEYNSMARLIKIGKGSNDRNGSYGQLTSNSFITADTKAQVANLCVSEWNGFLNDLSTRFLPTSLMGQIQVRITLANNAVLVPAIASGPNAIIPATLTANQATNAASMTYSINNIRFSIDAISVCPAYNEMLSQQLSREGLLKLNFKEYYTFLAANILSNRFALASTSIDQIYGSLRPATYNANGQPATQVFAANTGGYVCNYLAFQCFDPDTDISTPVSNLQSQFSINNVLMPQYLESIEDAACDVGFVWDKLGQGAMGIIPTTRANYKTGFFEVPLVLNHPSGMGLSVRSGYNSRGVNSTMIWSLYNIPTGGAGQLPASYNNIVVVGTTAQLKIGIGRSLAIDF
jgi:hypothetical protein